MAEPFRVQVEDLRLPPNVPAGMNYLLLGSLAYGMRSNSEDLEPIIVKFNRFKMLYQISDGRHRFIAAVIAGRPDILCVEEEK